MYYVELFENLYHENEPYKQIDVLLPLSKSFNYYWQNKVERKINNIKIFLVSKKDLINIKEKSKRLQDKKDLELLKKIK